MYSKKKKIYSVFILFFLMASVCQAEEQTTVNQELDEVIVSASRVEEKVKETPTTTNIVASDEIEDVKFRNPAEILNRLPGIYTHDFGGESELTSIRVPTHFTNGYTMVFVDGVPTTSYGTGSSGQITDLNDRNIERIEVVKGPSSALYGSNAIGGIINIITKDPSPEPEVNFWAEYGEYEQYTGGVSASDSGQKVSYNLDVNYKDAEGWRENSAINKKVGTGKLQFAPTDSSLLGLKVEMLSSENESAGSLDEADFIEDWRHSYYPISETTMDKYVGTITYNYFLQNGEFKTVVNVRKIDHTTLPHYNIRQIKGKPGTPHLNDYHGYFNDIQGLDTDLQLLYSRDMSFWRSKLIVGLDAEYGGTETDQDNLEVYWDPARKQFTSYTFVVDDADYQKDNKLLDVTTKVTSPYLQLAASPFGRLRLTAGGRFDMVTYEVDDKLNGGTAGDMSGDKDFSKFSPKVGATYEVNNNLNVYASYSEGFVVPTESQLFTSTNYNPQLDPEKAENYEIGLRSRFWDRRIDLDVAAYTMTIEDKIAQLDRTSTYYNAAESSMKGIETVFVLRPTDMFSISCAYTYARNKWETYVVDTSTGPAVSLEDYSGNTQARSPEHHFNIRLAVMPFAGFTAELEVDKISSQYGDDANEVSYSRPTLVNLRTSYDWENWSFWAHLTNLTDKKYATYLSGEEGDMGYYSGKPRTFFAGLSYRWGS